MMKSLALSAVLVGFAIANVEKTIFIAPPSISIPRQHPNLDDLRIQKLSPGWTSIRTYLNASFPAPAAEKGSESWLLLDGLRPSQRYELRICWLATQPTSFWIYTHTLTDVFDSPSLLSSLSTYSYVRIEELQHLGMEQSAIDAPLAAEPTVGDVASVLLLQIYAAADYFTLNETLMSEVPPVLVDVILDPYIGNIFPKSLLPTALYIGILALLSWFLSDSIWKWIVVVSADATSQPKAHDRLEAAGKKKE